MNYSTAVMLINTNIRAVNVAYDNDTEKTKASRTMFKTLDADIAPGDIVVLPTAPDHRCGFTTGRVTEVDIDVDFDSATECRWIAGKFDPAPFQKLLGEEEKYVALIKKGEQLKRRNDIAANLDALKVDGLKNLPIAHYGDKTAIADNTVPGGTQNTAATDKVA